MTAISFEYNIVKSELKETSTITLSIQNFLRFLEENTYKEFRTRHPDHDDTDSSDGSDMKIEIKINFQRDNNTFDIYYHTLEPVVLKSDLMMEYIKYGQHSSDYHSVVNKKEYHSLGAYKWQHIRMFNKQDFKNSSPMYRLSNKKLYLEFKFKVIRGIEEPAGTLFNDFEYVLKNELFSDVTILSTDKHEYKVHKAFLVSRSSVLMAHFKHNTIECSSNVVESPFESEVLKEVLTFIYSDKSPRITEIPEQLLAAADYYQISRLKSICEEALCKKLTIDNAIDTLQLADLHSAETLKQWTLEFIKDYVWLITKTESWAQINCVKLIKMILEYMASNDLEDCKVNEIQYYDLIKA